MRKTLPEETIMTVFLDSRKGFTLVELAIVLVIIGIILGAVLKGQDLITNAKLKRLYNQQGEIFVSFHSYYDKYGKFPGDDNSVSERWAGTVNGDNDGLIDDNFVYDCAGGEVAGQESCNAWHHLRLANIIIGAKRTNPQHPYGGAISMAYGTINTISANWIAFQNIPRDIAWTMDTQYDDGVWNTGSIQCRANVKVEGVPVVLYFKF